MSGSSSTEYFSANLQRTCDSSALQWRCRLSTNPSIEQHYRTNEIDQIEEGLVRCKNRRGLSSYFSISRQCRGCFPDPFFGQFCRSGSYDKEGSTYSFCTF